MSFIVIEGDNATGKTSLCTALAIKNVVHDIGLNVLNAKLKQLPKVRKIPAFLHYNMLCGLIAQNETDLWVLDRYWPSTISAAFADGIYDKQTAWKEVETCLCDFPAPLVTIFLRCPEDLRLKRIKERRKVTGDITDSTDSERHRKYDFISKYIESRMNSKLVFETDKVPSEIIAEKVMNFITTERFNVTE